MKYCPLILAPDIKDKAAKKYHSATFRRHPPSPTHDNTHTLLDREREIFTFNSPDPQLNLSLTFEWKIHPPFPLPHPMLPSLSPHILTKFSLSSYSVSISGVRFVTRGRAFFPVQTEDSEPKVYN